MSPEDRARRALGRTALVLLALFVVLLWLRAGGLA